MKLLKQKWKSLLASSARRVEQIVTTIAIAIIVVSGASLAAVQAPSLGRFLEPLPLLGTGLAGIGFVFGLLVLWLFDYKNTVSLGGSRKTHSGS